MHDRANDIIYAAKGLVGVPYRHQGRSQVGLDCAGLIIVVGQMVGVMGEEAGATKAYPRRPDAVKFTVAMVAAGLVQRPFGTQEHGDILRINTAGWPVHLGLYEVDENGAEWYIHSYLPHKKVTRDPLTPEVRRIISSVWRYSE